MKTLKKMLALFMCLCLMAGVFALPASAATSYKAEYDINVGQPKTIYLYTNDVAMNVYWSLQNASEMRQYVTVSEQTNYSCKVTAKDYYDGVITLKCSYSYYDNSYRYTSKTLKYALVIVRPPHTVRFDPNGGSVYTTSKTVNHGNSLGTLPTPTRSGYIFEGWYYSGGGRANSWDVCTGNITLSARWLQDIDYTVTFDPNGGSGGKTSKTVKNGIVIGDMPTPTRSGYSFDGWYTSASGGSLKTSSSVVSSNLDLYAHWVLNITVTYNANGGSVSPTSTVIKQGSSVSSLPTPTRAEHTFDGWFTKASGGDNVTTSTVFNSNTTIYAHWTADIKVTLNANGGTLSQQYISFRPGTAIGELPVPSRTGHSFDGWFTKASGGDPVTSSTSFSANTTVYAQWTADIKVTLNANGGTLSQKYISFRPGTAIGELPVPSRTGHSFDGWFTKTSGGENVTASTIFSSSTTIYAHWTADIRVTLDATGGTLSQKYISFRPGTAIGELPEPAREYHQFDGWYTSSNGGEKVSSSTTFNASSTIYARWIADVRITFNATGGSVDPTFRMIHPNTSVGELPTPTRSGYTFDGWYESAYGSVEITSSDAFDKDTVIYAQWIAEITITLDPAGGIIYPTSISASEGKRIGDLPEPILDGYVFLGWYTAAQGGSKATKYSAFRQNTVLYAHWERGVLITFERNDFTDSVIKKTVKTGDPAGELPDADRSGFSFAGWYTEEKGGTQVKSTDVFSADKTVYAQWIADIWISFDPVGGTVSPGIKRIAGNSKAGALPEPIREGCTFDGWYTKYTGGEKVNESTVFSNSVTVYAHWLSDITVRFDPNGEKIGYGQDKKVVRAGTAIGSLPTPTSSDYTFVGWYTKDDSNNKITSASVFYEDTTLYAAWSVKLDNFTFLINTDKTVTLTKYSGTDSTVDIPDSIDGYPVTRIIGAFSENRSIQSVYIPEGIVEIGDSSFLNCKNLTCVSLPDSLTKIGRRAFYSCSALPEITFPDNLSDLEDSAFYGCTKLKSIGPFDGLEHVASGAFFDTAWYNSQKDGVVYVGKIAYAYFGTCSTSVAFREGTEIINNYLFYNNTTKTNLRNVTFPDGVTTIGQSAFEGCSGLRNFTLPEGVATIGHGAFSKCSGLTNIVLPESATDLKGAVFYECTSLSSLHLPNDLTYIPDSLCYNCKKLTTVNIPNGVTKIGDAAFSRCSSLNWGSLPSGLESLGLQAFSICTFPAELSIPEGVVEIQQSAIVSNGSYGSNGLKSVIIPGSVKSIGSEAIGYYAYNITGTSYSTAKTTGFTIYGYDDTEAQRYAEKQGFTFVSLGEYLPDVIGDADNDGCVTVSDATFIQRDRAGIPLPFAPDLKKADADGDKQITVMDATLIQKWLEDAVYNDELSEPII